MAEILSSHNTIGVVAIGRNEGERLKRCLGSISPDLPVVYVDSNSSDGSLDYARNCGAIGVALDISRPFTAARARNAGFAALIAAHPGLEYVQFVDGDCEFEPAWIDRAAVFLQDNPEAVVVCGRRQERFPNASIYNRLCDIEWNTPIGEAEACGGDSLMRISAFQAVGGFDDAAVAGEEPELCKRLREKGGKIWRIDAAMTIHDAAMFNFGQWWRRAVRGGFGYAQAWSTRRIYGRAAMRSIFWAGILPFSALILGLIASPLWLCLFLVPGVQIIRDAIKLRGTPGYWSRAFFMMVAKFPELQGILRFARQSGATTLAAPKSYK